MSTETLVLQSSPIITIGYVMQVLLSLGVVVTLIYVSAKFLLPRLKPTGGGKIVRILDRVFLEPQVTAYVLKAGKAAWLVVISNKQIAKIDRVDDEGAFNA